MVSITGTAYMDLDCYCNDNALVMVLIYNGMAFTGYKPVKPPVPKPSNAEVWFV